MRQTRPLPSDGENRHADVLVASIDARRWFAAAELDALGPKIVRGHKGLARTIK